MMKNEENDIIKQKQSSLTFTFEHQDNKLFINAQTDDILYCGFIKENQLITFDKIKKVLDAKNYELVAKNNQRMEIIIAGVFDLKLKSQYQNTQNDLKETIQKLTLKLDSQVQKKTQLQETVNKMQTQISLIETKIEQQKKDKTSLIDQLREQLAQTQSKIQQQQSQIEINNKTQKQLVEELRQQILQMREENSQQKESINQNSQKINQLFQEINELLTKNIEHEEQIKKFISKTKTVKELINQTKAIVQQLQDTVNNYHQTQSEKITLLKEDSTKQKEKINQVSSKIDLNSQDIERCVKSNDELKARIFSLEMTNSQVRNQFTTTNHEDQQQVTNLTAQLSELRTQFDHLINQTIPKCITYGTQFFRFSRIVRSSEEKLNIRGFFGNKTIMQAKLLYRASDHQFSAKKFHEKCNGIPNTLSVIWTEYDKKIGGFTPLKWSSPQKEESVADNSKESFIFSLTHNDKFTLQQPDSAILNHCDDGPIFGSGNDIIVSDKANSNNYSNANICSSYHNEKYKNGDQASWERFCGNPNNLNQFKVKECQVWRVELK